MVPSKLTLREGMLQVVRWAQAPTGNKMRTVDIHNGGSWVRLAAELDARTLEPVQEDRSSMAEVERRVEVTASF